MGNMSDQLNIICHFDLETIEATGVNVFSPASDSEVIRFVISALIGKFLSQVLQLKIDQVKFERSWVDRHGLFEPQRIANVHVVFTVTESKTQGTLILPIHSANRISVGTEKVDHLSGESVPQNQFTIEVPSDQAVFG